MDVTALLAQADNGTDTPLLIAGLVSLALGVLILLVPRILNYVVAAYLIIVGVIWLIAAFD